MTFIKRAIAALSVAIASMPASALVVDAFDRGWYRRNTVTGVYDHQTTNLNYITGFGFLNVGTPAAPINQAVVTRSFFGFDLSAYAGQSFTAATLHLYNPRTGDPIHNPLGDSTASNNGFFQFNSNPANTRACAPPSPALSLVACEGFELYDVVSNINAVLNGPLSAADSTTFNDLGSGTAYGNYVASASDNGRFIDITLNTAGLAAINAAVGSRFLVGGRLTTVDAGLGSQTVFGFTDQDLPDTQLILTPAQVPEPGALCLMGAALFALGVTRRRKGLRVA